MENLSEQLVKDLRAEIEEMLTRRFTHRDYLGLTAKWKLETIKQMTSVIITLVDMEIERYKIEKGISDGRTDA